VLVDNFIYTEALTKQTLNGNFKAYEFFWRYHKAHGELPWESFSTALRLQFRQSHDGDR